MDSLLKTRFPKAKKQIIYTVVAASVYHIWSITNHATFNNKHITGNQTIQQIKEHARHRILHMNKISGKYTKYIDRLLK